MHTQESTLLCLATPPADTGRPSPVPSPAATSDTSEIRRAGPSASALPAATDILFDPPKERIPEILDHLDSPYASLQNVAAANDTTIEALALWMQRPEIVERTALIDSTAAQRTRSLATRNLRRAVAALSTILERATEEDADPAFTNHPKAHLARTRNRDLICRAARLLMQLYSLPLGERPQTRRGGSESRRGDAGVGGVGLAERATSPTSHHAPQPAPTVRVPTLSLHDLRARAGAIPNGRHNSQSNRKPRPT